MAKLFNRAGMSVSGTPGTGTITLGSAITSPKKYLDFATAGVANTDVVSYLIEDGVEFEHGIGTYTSSGTTLSRDTVRKSSNAGAKISATSAALVYIDAGTEDVGPVIDKQTFDASGTWTKPVGSFTSALIECWGGGGSGANRTTTGSAGGGGGGSYNFRQIAFSSLGSTETVTIGAGGAAVASSNANGNDGGTTSFGTWLSAYGGGGGSNAAAASNASGGGGGGLLSGAALNVKGDPEGIAGNVGTKINAVGRGGGATGGGVNTSNVGADGGNSIMGGAGGGSTNSGGTPANNSGGTAMGGGNGGAASSTGAATAGTQPAGGGGAARNGQTSGKGGDGRVIVTCY